MAEAYVLAETLVADVVAVRRDIHRHPELGFRETRTAGIVAARLRALGYEVHEGIGVTGVVGVLRTGRPGKTIMLRADMDALPLAEETSHGFASETAGTMHACGHDGHVAILLGAAAYIAERADDASGTLVFCFQPAEEGLGGAKAMLEDRLIERFGIERAYGLHLFSTLPTGVFGFREGPFFASSDSIEIRIDGSGGHGAAPQHCVDPIPIAAEFVSSVQKIVSREIDPLEPAVVTIGAIHAGTTHNVIPSYATLLGTVRAFDAGVRERMAERIERVLRGVCASGGATYSFDYLWRYPVTSNDDEQTRYVRAIAERTFGPSQTIAADRQMGAEDFSFFAERVPACYFVLGSNGGPATAQPHHSGKFDIDEAALAPGVRMFVALALDAPLGAP